ncbi:helix-turn-helix domain-containing protein [bacterium]|nr:MAG: helix-turn-helix domain-containing protein [bacterium]
MERDALHRTIGRTLNGESSTVEALADLEGYSPAHFARRFRGLVGEPLATLARRVRLERAAWQLRYTELSVGEVGLEAGYDAPDAFGRAFRACFGSSPTEYRRFAGHVSLLPSPSGVHWRFPSIREETMQPKIIPFGTKRVATKRHVGETPGIDRTWAWLNEENGKREIDRTNARFFTRCMDGPEVDPSAIRYDLLFTVPEDFEPYEGLDGISELPGGEYAVFVHQGPDDLIVDTWARAFTDWLPKSGRTFNGVCFEEYVNGFYLRPERPDERLIVTAVYLGLE